jgi:hypothetical protein
MEWKSVNIGSVSAGHYPRNGPCAHFFQPLDNVKSWLAAAPIRFNSETLHEPLRENDTSTRARLKRNETHSTRYFNENWRHEKDDHRDPPTPSSVVLSPYDDLINPLMVAQGYHPRPDTVVMVIARSCIHCWVTFIKPRRDVHFVR